MSYRLIGYIDFFEKEKGWTIFIPIFKSNNRYYKQQINALTGKIEKFLIIESCNLINFNSNTTKKKGEDAIYIERKINLMGIGYIKEIKYFDFIIKLKDDLLLNEKKILNRIESYFYFEISTFLKTPSLIDVYTEKFRKYIEINDKLDISTEKHFLNIEDYNRENVLNFYELLVINHKSEVDESFFKEHIVNNLSLGIFNTTKVIIEDFEKKILHNIPSNENESKVNNLSLGKFNTIKVIIEYFEKKFSHNIPSNENGTSIDEILKVESTL